MTPRSVVELVGVPFSSTGRLGGIAAAIAVLRSCHLAERLGERVTLRDSGDLELVDQTSARAPGQLRNEGGLVSLTAMTRAAVGSALARGNLPLLVGGDCPVMLGALAALRDHTDAAGLVMIDGHEDAYPPGRSPTGEASDSELGIALGLFDETLPAELAELTPLLSPEAVALVGSRDAGELTRYGVASLADRIWLRTDFDVRQAGAQATAREATALVSRASRRFWLHVDLDVLRSEDFPAADYRQEGGLTWNELELATSAILSDPGCAGWSAAIYNPDLDPRRTSARTVVEFLVATIDAAID
ncbi:MAG: arginase family protein [Solirubrobacteraceae bacterium]